MDDASSKIYYKAASKNFSMLASPEGHHADLLNRSENNFGKKGISLALEGSAVGMKTPQNRLKINSNLSKEKDVINSAIFSSSKSVTSQLMKNFANKGHDSNMAKVSLERGVHFEKGFKNLPPFPTEERTKTLGNIDIHRIDIGEPYTGSEMNLDDMRTNDIYTHRKAPDMLKHGAGRTPKLPMIRQSGKGSDDKYGKRKNSTDKRAVNVFGKAIDVDSSIMNANVNVSRKLFEAQSPSPTKNLDKKGRRIQMKVTQIDISAANDRLREDGVDGVAGRSLLEEGKLSPSGILRPHVLGQLEERNIGEMMNVVGLSPQKTDSTLHATGPYDLSYGGAIDERLSEDAKGDIALSISPLKIRQMSERASQIKMTLDMRKRGRDQSNENARQEILSPNLNKKIPNKAHQAQEKNKKSKLRTGDDVAESEYRIKTDDLDGWDKNESDKDMSRDEDDEDTEQDENKIGSPQHFNGERTISNNENDNKRDDGSTANENNQRGALKGGKQENLRPNRKAIVKEVGNGNLVKFGSKKGTGDKDETAVKREMAYKAFMQRMNFSFNVIVHTPQEKTFNTYKYFLGKGNNSIMIKSMMKNRWWWVQADKEASDLNFMWTQLKVTSFIDSLNKRRKTPFEGLENNNSGVLSQINATDTTQNSTTMDSMTDCESDTTESDSRSNSVVARAKKGKTSLKTPKGKDKSAKKSEKVENDENFQALAMKKLYTNHEIMLMGGLEGKKVLYPEDFEEIGKLRKGPPTQVIEQPNLLKMCNHVENNFHLANKKALLWNMKSYYEAIKKNVFDHLPLTFHVRNGLEDKEYLNFVEYYQNREQEIKEQERVIQETFKETGKKSTVKKLRNLWIVKPGENTNRGVGIHVCNELSQIKDLIATTSGEDNGKKRTYLIQQYLDRPLLYNKRKFDIRCYILISCINGTMKGYWYQEGYIRTATKEFSLKNVTNRLIHLTNDAVQKKAEDYGKFEAGNKLSYNDFQKYLDTTYDGKVNFMNQIYPQIRNLAIDAIKGVYGKMDPYRRENCFEVFGLDFMIDSSIKAWLIEVNTNPDINASSPALVRVIPNMVENALRLTIDQMFPPPVWHLSKKLSLPENLLENNKFELVFDEVEDGAALRSILNPEKGATGDMLLEIVAEEEDEIEDEGND